MKVTELLDLNCCGDCGAEEGMFHDWGCDMERCPFCGGQLISCECPYEYFGLNGEEELTEKQEEEWYIKCEEMGRIPYILIFTRCAMCGKEWDKIWMTSDDEWQKYTLPELQKECLCESCFERLKKIFPDGWRNAKPFKHPFWEKQ